MQCPNCEKNVSGNARFCDQCGHALEIPPQVILEEPINPVEAEMLPLDHDVSAAEEQLMTPDPVLAIEPLESELAENEPVHLPIEENVFWSVDIEPNEPESAAISAIAPTDKLPTVGPLLVLKNDQGEGETSYPLPTDHAIIVGREDPIDGVFPDIDLTPYDTDIGVSRQHASLHEQGGQWFIQDLASTNYTIVNRRRLTPHEDYLLEDGDALRFGRVMAEFRM